MRKIAVLSSGHIPSQWAHSINVTKHADAFFNMGFETTILTVKRYPEKKFAKKIKDINSFYGISKSIPIKFFTDHSIHYFRETFLFNRLIILLDYLTNGKLKQWLDPERKMSKFCRKEKFNLAYCRNYRSAIYNIRNGVPTIVEIHNINTANPFIRKVISLSGSCFLKKIVTIDNLIKEKFIELGAEKDKIVVLEDAADIEKFEEARKNNRDKEIRKKLGIKEGVPIAMYIGQFQPEKGVKYILQAAALKPEYIFVIVGGSEKDIKLQKKYLDKINRGNGKNVVFAGYVSNEEVPYYCQAADILLIPYTSESVRKFMSPIKMFEYLAAGKPIVASDLPNLNKVLKDQEHCLLIKEKNPREINAAIQNLLRNKELYERISKNNLEYSKNFTYQNRVKEILRGLY